MVGKYKGGTTCQDIETPTSAAGDDTEAWRWGAAAGDSDDTGPSGANGSEADFGADL